MASNDEKIEHFMAVTGSAAREEAMFFLESSGWDVEVAVMTYMDGRDAEPEAAPGTTAAQGSSDVAEPSAAKPSITVKEDSKPSDSEQRWFTGGGAGSGQEVIAPSKGRKPVDDVFNAAMEMGARHATSEDINPSSGAFSGGARTLAGGVVKAKEPPKQHVIKFYANEVFTVDDGPPRNIHDPQNKAFLDCIVRGEIPPEFLGGSGAESDADVQLMNIAEDYEPPAQSRVVAFQGTGNRLGGSTSGAGPSHSQPPVAAVATVWEGPDTSQPMTSLQLRLPDGSRMVAKFNHNQPVSDIRRFVASARPDLPSNYSMRTGFPAKPVADESLSLEAAGLLSGTVILQ